MSIARVMLKNPMLLIFDEATSSLDSISETLIQDAIDPMLTGRTSIVIAHRLSTIMAADEILVVSEGKIVERGAHADLVRLGGVYTELYETQFRRALEDYEERKTEDSAVLATVSAASADAQPGIPGSGPDWQPDEWLSKLDVPDLPDFPPSGHPPGEPPKSKPPAGFDFQKK